MGDSETIFWSLFGWLPPILAGFGSGLWLLRRGQRLAGSLFLAWAVVGVALLAVDFWVMLDWQHQPGVTAADWYPVVEGIYFGMHVINAMALTAFVVALFRRKAGQL